MKCCDKCGREMPQGYVILDGLEYYCSEECLHKVYSEEEYARMYEEGNAFWTDWTGDD